MKNWLIAILLCTGFTSYAQTTWEKKLNVYHDGKFAPGDATSILEMPDKGFIVTGNGTTTDSKHIGFIYKLDKNGDSVWKKTYEMSFLGRMARVFYNRDNQLMVAMDMLIKDKKHNIVFARLDENTGDTSNSFAAAKPNSSNAYKYVSHVEMEDGSYIVLATDISTTYEGASHLFRFMPGSNIHIWNADSLATRVWKFSEMWLDGDGLMLAGSGNTGIGSQSFMLVRYGLDGKPRWSGKYPAGGDYLNTYANSVVKLPDGKFMAAGDKIALIDGVWQNTPAVAIFSANGDTLKNNILTFKEPGSIRKIIKSGSNYYGVGQSREVVKDPDGKDVSVYSFALYNINADGSFTVAKEYNAGIVPGTTGGYMSTWSEGRGLISATDGDLVLFGIGASKRADQSTYYSPYIIKTKAPTGSVRIAEYNKINTLSVYPNPAKNNLIINTENVPGQLRIVNLFGQEIYYAQINKNEIVSVDVTHFPAGTYMVKLVNASGISTSKFIKAE
ncbi:MAG: T9SS type A sorting domain-containing protein [Sphingobacteriales bacterium]|nr:MAG: T9SS type A sorting domain-containing protein [Sphingobacteriales bacterium]